MYYTTIRDYLKKVAEAKKQRNEYLKKGIKGCETGLTVGLVGMMTSAAILAFILAIPNGYGINTDILGNVFLSLFCFWNIIVMSSAISYFIKKTANKKEFSEKFPKEASLILEYEELTKEEE